MGVQQLATVIADAVAKAKSTVGIAERATISGSTVITSHGAYTYDLACDIVTYDGKSVWIQLADDGTAVIIGE